MRSSIAFPLGFLLLAIAACSNESSVDDPDAGTGPGDAVPDAGGGGGGGAGDAPYAPEYPGQPPEGALMWGASIAGLEDYGCAETRCDPGPRHEEPTGVIMTIHRTFFQWGQRATGMVNWARDDLEIGRLPWVSTKTPSWADMAAGDHDEEIDEMLEGLEALGGPVWLTMHHEPEGGGGVNEPDDPAGPSGHVAMNRRVRERMQALGTENIALAPILMAWTWNALSGRDPNEWWDEGIYDFLGIDHYTIDSSLANEASWLDVREWAADRGVDVAVGEWGTHEVVGEFVSEWFEHAAASHADGLGARVTGLCAFDSGLNAGAAGTFELRGDQLVVFRELFSDPRNVNVVGLAEGAL